MNKDKLKKNCWKDHIKDMKILFILKEEVVKFLNRFIRKVAINKFVDIYK